jgi:phage terminase Nu1 subunit (DNA packaging protein)
MTTIHVQSEVSLDALLNGVEQLNTADLEHFADKVLALRAKRRAANIPRREAELLQQINQGVPQEIQRRFDELTTRRREDLLTPEEHQELLQLIDQIEQLDVKRVEALAELAQLRKVSLRKLMKQLGLRPPAYA